MAIISILNLLRGASALMDKNLGSCRNEDEEPCKHTSPD